MHQTLTYAPLKKRIPAALIDALLVLLVTALLVWGLGALANYSAKIDRISEITTQYELSHQVNFSITEEVYQSLPAEERARYDLAIDAMRRDPAMVDAYGDLTGSALWIVALSFFVALLGLEILLPLSFKKRGTLGKQLLGLSLAQADLTPVRTSTLLGRVLIGKYLIETMLPVLVLIMTAFEVIELPWIGILLLTLFALVQVLVIAGTRLHVPVHSLISGTVTVQNEK